MAQGRLSFSGPRPIDSFLAFRYRCLSIALQTPESRCPVIIIRPTSKPQDECLHESWVRLERTHLHRFRRVRRKSYPEEFKLRRDSIAWIGGLARPGERSAMAAAHLSSIPEPRGPIEGPDLRYQEIPLPKTLLPMEPGSRGRLIAKFGENRGAEAISRKNYRASIGWSRLPT